MKEKVYTQHEVWFDTEPLFTLADFVKAIEAKTGQPASNLFWGKFSFSHDEYNITINLDEIEDLVFTSEREETDEEYGLRLANAGKTFETKMKYWQDEMKSLEPSVRRVQRKYIIAKENFLKHKEALDEIQNR